MPRSIETHERQTHERAGRAPAPAPSSDRAFGLVMTAFFGVVGALPLLGGRPFRAWALAVSAGFLVSALAAPGLLAPLHFAWGRLGLLLRRFVQPVFQTVILAGIYFGVVTPIALLGRALGKDPLRLSREPAAKTYWIVRDPPGPAPDSLGRQF